MPSWSHLGAILGRLGAILGPSWGHLGVIGAILGHLGAILGPSWAILGYLGAVLGPCWAILGHLEPFLISKLGSGVGGLVRFKNGKN